MIYKDMRGKIVIYSIASLLIVFLAVMHVTAQDDPMEIPGIDDELEELDAAEAEIDAVEEIPAEVPAEITVVETVIDDVPDALDPGKERQADGLADEVAGEEVNTIIELDTIDVVEPGTGIPTVEPGIEPVIPDIPDDIPAVEPGIEPVISDIPTVEPGIEPVISDIPAVEPGIDPVISDIPTVEPGIDPLDVGLYDVDPGIDPGLDPIAEPEPPVVASGPEHILRDQVILKLEANEIEARANMKAAEIAFQRGDYKNAMELYLKAAGKFPKREANKEARLRAEDGMAISSYLVAVELSKNKDTLHDAMLAVNRAIEFKPDFEAAHKLGAKIVVLLQKKDVKAPTPPPKHIPRWGTKDYKYKVTKIKELLRDGREHLMLGEYEEAEVQFKSVLGHDPYHRMAMGLLLKTERMMHDAVRQEYPALSEKMVAQVRDAWLERDHVEFVVETLPDFVATSRTIGPEKLLLKKMQKLIIPEIEFRLANINDVIQFLVEQSREVDQSPDGQKGVSIVLHLGKGSGAAPAPPVDDGFGMGFPVEGEVPAAPGAGVEPVTCHLFSTSLFDALDIITSLVGLEYRIQGNVVMIVPPDLPVRGIILRTYNVAPTFRERIDELRAAGVTPGDDAGGDIFDPDPGGGGGGGGDLKDIFRGMGVKFPAGSSVRYVPSLGKLFVSNTPENLAKFEEVLAEIDVVPKQVEIEARFVEIAQNDAEELGVEWLLSDRWELLQRKGSGSLPPSMRESIMMEGNAGDGGFTKSMHYMALNDTGTGGEIVPGRAVGSAPFIGDIMKISSVLTNPELGMVLHALAASGQANLLSAPKITTRSGEEATIKVVREFIYPTQFSVTEVTGQDAFGNTTIIGGIVEPGGFEMREVGVVLEVLPEVSPEGTIINLRLRPEVVEDPVWHEYGTVITGPTSTNILSMPQPFFHSRSVETSISIYDQATVVMGGMITENKRVIDDKIPILGDIPLLGALFRSKGEYSEKRNLLIFVTARLVDPAGKSIKPPKKPKITPPAI